MNDKEFTFYNLFKILLKDFKFKLKHLMFYFRVSQINAAKNIYPQTNNHYCFFQYSQAIWNNFKNYKLWGNGTYKDDSKLLFNLQLLYFIKKEKEENTFDKIKKNIKIISQLI